MIILDTNVLAVLMGTSSNDGAEGWLRLQDPAELRITAITRAEVRYGIARLPAGRRRSDYERAADAFFTSQRSRVLAFDAIAADMYGDVVADRERAGRPIGIADAQIAAIALVNHAVVATRDRGGFDLTGVEVIDPFA